MKKLIAGVVLVVAVSACGSKTYYVTEAPDSTPAPVTTTRPPVQTTQPYTPSPTYGRYLSFTEQSFVDSVHDLYSGVIYISDEDLINIGRTTCSALQNGATGDQVLDVILSTSGYDTSLLTLLSSIAAAAVAWFCPEQAWKFA